jgi:filamentous hemagglutinin family protein
MSGITGGAIWRYLLGTSVGGAWMLSANCTLAQIVPDSSLPNNSTVTINGNTFNITEGTQAGRNLFHSFQQFSVPTGGTASFNNGLDVQNIFSRVTGGSVSNIDGIIRASGTANLFFLNPNGIVFGRNASLNVGGSFVASTANSLKFADGFEFNATAGQTPSLLTISVPSGIQFGTNPGSIQILGDGQGSRSTPQLIDTTSGLRVGANQTLALVGGELNLEGATLKTAGGRIELGSVVGNSLVSITQMNKGFSLGYGGVQNFGNIQLSQRAGVDASGEGGGDIQVSGRNVILTDGSQIEASTLGSKPGGSLVVNSQDSVQLIGASADGQFPSGLSAQVYKGATGKAGDLTITTGDLFVNGGGQIGVGTVGSGNGGNLTVNAKTIQVTGTSPDGQYVSGLFADAARDSTGKAGDLTITTGELFVNGGGEINASTFGSGNGGNLTVNAKTIQVTGTSPDGQYVSGLFADAARDSTGKAGDLTITTGELFVNGGGQIGAGTFGSGNGGNLTVNAKTIQVTGTTPNGQYASGLFTQANRDSTGKAGDLTITTGELFVNGGGRISAGTAGLGNGGNLTVNAKTIQVTGTTSNGLFPSGLSTRDARGSTGKAGDLTITTGELFVSGGGDIDASTYGSGNGGNLTVNAKTIQVTGTSPDGQYASGLFARAEPGSTGKAGDLTIKTHELFVQGGTVSVQNAGTGTAGNLNINARSIRLDDGILVANTLSNKTGSNQQQATIIINSGDLILSRSSNIIANARGTNVIGGNIKIDTDVLAAIENSKISADSVDFRGGQVNIKAQGIFLLSNSSITARGVNQQLNGTVQIKTPDSDPTRSLVILPTITENTPKLVSSGCSTFNEASGGSQFTITGRGGLPPSPSEPLTTEVLWTDARLAVVTTQQHQHKTHAAKLKAQPITIIPATGWVSNDKGEVTLVSTATNASAVNTPSSCPVR